MRLIVIVTLMLPLVGCTASPTAKVTDVFVDEQTAQGTRLMVVVELNNPRSTPFPLPKTNYSVVLNEETFRFQIVPDVTLPANSTQTLHLPAAFSSSRSLTGSAYRVSGDVFYEPPGEVRRLLTDYRIPLPSAGFSTRGTLH